MVVRGRFARWWPLAAVVVAGVLGLAVGDRHDPLPGEIAYVERLQALAEPVPSIAEVVRVTTSTEAGLVALAAAAPWLLRRYRLAGGIAIAVLVATVLVVQPAVKELIDRPRPTVDQVDVRADHTSMSYPSGHSMSTTAVWGTAVGLAHQRRRSGVAGAASIPIALTFVASGVQGVHWPSDALGGTLLGAAAAAVTVRVLSSSANTQATGR